MADPFRKRSIPPGSTFHVRVSRRSDSGRYDAAGHYEPPAAAQQSWSHAQLTAGGGLQRQLNQANGTYRGDLSLVFDTQTSARVRMEVRKPGGSLHGDRYDQSFAGSGGRLVRVYFSLKTTGGAA